MTTHHETRTRRSGSGRTRGGRSAQHAEATITAKNLTGDERRFLERHKDDLSRSTLRAKWIHSPNEHEDRPGQTLATRNHHVIRAWAEARGGRPATAARRDEGRPRVLRFDFPQGDQGRGHGSLEQIGWDEWFKTFDDRQVVFIYQEHMRAGNDSNFFRLDSPKREDG